MMQNVDLTSVPDDKKVLITLVQVRCRNDEYWDKYALRDPKVQANTHFTTHKAELSKTMKATTLLSCLQLQRQNQLEMPSEKGHSDDNRLEIPPLRFLRSVESSHGGPQPRQFQMDPSA